jgi:biofilm PGA synthesis protein PgaD
MSKRPLIIDNPELQTPRQRYAFAAVTLVFWVLWFYLWIPIVSLLAWLFGAERFYQEMISKSGLDALIEILGLYAIIILTMGIILSGWAWYNQLRFRGHDKRRASAVVTPAEAASFFALKPEQLDLARYAKHVVIEHDDHGNIRDIRVG